MVNETKAIRDHVLIGDSLANATVLTIDQARVELNRLQNAIESARDYRSRRADSDVYAERQLQEDEQSKHYGGPLGTLPSSLDDTGTLPIIKRETPVNAASI